MRRALVPVLLAATLAGTAAVPAVTLAQTRVPDPPAPQPKAERPQQAPPETPAPSADGRVDGSSPGWVVPAVIAVAALAVLLFLLSLTPLDPGRALTRPRRALAEGGARTAEAFAGLWDRVRLGR